MSGLLLVSPTNIITGLQTQSAKNPIYKGPLDAMKKIAAEKGIAGLYKGQVATLWREGPGYASYFVAYELLMQREMAAKGIRRDQIAASHTILYGAIAGYAVCFTIPSSLQCSDDIIVVAVVYNLPRGRDQVSNANRRPHTSYRSKILFNNRLRSEGDCKRRSCGVSKRSCPDSHSITVCQWCDVCWVRISDACPQRIELSSLGCRLISLTIDGYYVLLQKIGLLTRL
jgi:hypothetical protein